MATMLMLIANAHLHGPCILLLVWLPNPLASGSWRTWLVFSYLVWLPEASGLGTWLVNKKLHHPLLQPVNDDNDNNKCGNDYDYDDNIDNAGKCSFAECILYLTSNPPRLSCQSPLSRLTSARNTLPHSRRWWWRWWWRLSGQLWRFPDSWPCKRFCC